MLRVIDSTFWQNLGSEDRLDPRYMSLMLFMACMYGKTETAACLLEAGADPNRRFTVRRQTALHAACQRGDEIAVNVLLAHGAASHVDKDIYCRTPKQLAERHGHHEVAQLVAEHYRHFAMVEL